MDAQMALIANDKCLVIGRLSVMIKSPHLPPCLLSSSRNGWIDVKSTVCTAVIGEPGETTACNRCTPVDGDFCMAFLFRNVWRTRVSVRVTPECMEQSHGVEGVK